MKIRSTPLEKWAKVETPSATKTKEYYVSSMGRLKSVDKSTGGERLLKPTRSRRTVAMSVKLANNTNFGVFMARQVATHFVENPDNHDCVIHLDRDVENNISVNLKWVSASEQAIHILDGEKQRNYCLLYTSPSPRDRTRSRMPSSA